MEILVAEFLPNFTFKPFTGVIEDVTDPLGLGRVRVRAHGYHSTDTSEVPTDSLPWAHVTYNDSKRMSVPTNGEWVIGFFLDGDEAQKPIIIGTLPGIDDVEPATSKWARNDGGSSTGVSSASQYTKKTTQHTGTDITEPSNDYDAVYPHNKVIETSSGHLIEIDDTDGKERIHIYHKSGSFTEFHQDGTKVDKTEKDKYTITLGKEYIAVTGDYKIEGGGGSEFKINSSTGKLSYKNTLDATGVKGLLNDIITELDNLAQAVTKVDPSVTTVVNTAVVASIGIAPAVAGTGAGAGNAGLPGNVSAAADATGVSVKLVNVTTKLGNLLE